MDYVDGEKEPFQLLWKVYYDFFAVLSPKLESWMVKKNIKYEKLGSGDKRCKLNVLMTVVRNLFNCPINGDVFLLRQYCLHLIHGSDRFLINKISSKKKRKYYGKGKGKVGKGKVGKGKGKVGKGKVGKGKVGKGKVGKGKGKVGQEEVTEEVEDKENIYADFICHMKECNWKSLCETLVHMMNNNTIDKDDFGFYYSILKTFDVRITEEMAGSLWKTRNKGCSYMNHMHFLLSLAVCTQVPDEYVVHKKKPKIMLRTCDMEMIDSMNHHLESERTISLSTSLPLYDAYLSDAFYDGSCVVGKEGGSGHIDNSNVFDWLRKNRVYSSWYDMILPISKKCGKRKGSKKLRFYT